MQKILGLFRFMLPDLAFLFTNGLGFAGVIFIVYGIVSRYTTGWVPLEQKAQFLSSLLTLLGTIVTALSIYLPVTAARAPWPHSRYLVSPIVVVSCISAIWFLLRFKVLPPMLINGFALLAISGGLKRLFPNPHV